MKRFVLLGFGFLCVLMLAVPSALHAAGTPAYTVITNTATLNYKDLAGVSFPAVNASVSITVAQLAGVDLTPPTAAKTVGESLYVYYPFTVTNTGNWIDKYTLTISSTQGWSPLIYKDSDRNGVLDSVEIAAGNVTSTDSILADSSQKFVARFFVPFPTPNGTVDSLHVVAASDYTPSVTDAGTYVTTIAKAVVPVTKSANNHTPQPGQVVTYTIGYANNGSSPALNAVLSDTVSTDLVVGTISSPGTYNSGLHTITWNLGKLDPGANGTVTFQATVRANVPSGTVISNTAYIEFIDSTNGRKPKNPSPPESVTVSEKAGLAVVMTPDTLVQDVSLEARYRITLYNLGNFTDSTKFDFTTSLSQTWFFFTDANGDGIVNGGDHAIDPLNLGPIAQLDSMKFIAFDTIPHNTVDRSKDTLTVTFTSLAHPATSASDASVLTVRAPILTLSKGVSVVGGGLPVPGAELLYTIVYHDTGTGAASGVVVTDSIPANTDYVLNTLKLDGSALTDTNTDGDGADYTSGVITVSLGNVPATGSKIITFRVKIR